MLNPYLGNRPNIWSKRTTVPHHKMARVGFKHFSFCILFGIMIQICSNLFQGLQDLQTTKAVFWAYFSLKYLNHCSDILNNVQYNYGKTPQFARADADDVSEHEKTLCFVGQNAHVHDHGFHLATHSLATVRWMLQQHRRHHHHHQNHHHHHHHQTLIEDLQCMQKFNGVGN